MLLTFRIKIFVLFLLLMHSYITIAMKAFRTDSLLTIGWRGEGVAIGGTGRTSESSDVSL